MAQNHQINGGHGNVNNNNHQSTEAQELNRYITAPGDDDYQLILPDYRADIPKKFEDREYNIKPGIQPTEIIRHQRDDRDIRRAALLD